VTNAGLPPESSFRYGTGPANESRSAPPEPGWSATPTGHAGFQSNGPHYGGADQSFPRGRNANSAAVVIAAVVAVVVFGCGGFIAGRLTVARSALPAAGQTAASHDGTGDAGATSSEAPAAAPSAGINVTDPAGDAVPHPTEGRVYGPSDITNLSIRSDGTDLVITTVYTPSTPLNLLAAETAIRLDADKVPSCKNSVLDSADWLIDYDVSAGGVNVYKPPANCGERYEHTPITGGVEVTDSTVTIKIAQDSLGIRPGQRIVVRASASTRIDDGHTTFIQDRAPDSPSGATGAV
jgi:hypothetical protein